MKIKTSVDYPIGYLCVEDKISMLQKLSELEIREKKEGISSYSRNYDEMFKAISASIVKETKALDSILYEGDNNEPS